MENPLGLDTLPCRVYLPDEHAIFTKGFPSTPPYPVFFFLLFCAMGRIQEKALLLRE